MQKALAFLYIHCVSSQLHFDGYEGVAATLLQACSALPGIAPSQRLLTAVKAGMEAQGDGKLSSTLITSYRT